MPSCLTAGFWGAGVVDPAAAPVTTTNAFAAIGDMAAAAGSEQLSALTGMPFAPAMPGVFGYSWQQQHFMYPGAAAAAAAGPDVAVEEPVPAAVAVACRRQRGLDELLNEETDACMMSRCADYSRPLYDFESGGVTRRSFAILDGMHHT
jgi:hypothetical protein